MKINIVICCDPVDYLDSVKFFYRFFFFFSSRRRHTRSDRDWSSDVCSSDLGHVEAQELDAHRDRQLPRDLGLADASRAGEQEAADGLARLAEARARHLDGGGECLDGFVLSEDHERSEERRVGKECRSRWSPY